MNKKELSKTFARLADIDSTSRANYYVNCFLEAMRQGLVTDNKLELPHMFTISINILPPGERLIWNPSNHRWNTRKEHLILRITDNGDKLLKSHFEFKYKVEERE